MSIKEISNYLEFPNLSFFGKYVKAHLGCSPTEFRKKKSKQGDASQKDKQEK
jgi:AraC-like DNA-binding protein